MRKIILSASCLLLLVFLIFSCRKELKRPFWDIDLLAPLVKSSLTINNLVTNSLVHVNPNNSLDIVYKSSLYSFSVDTLFKIADTTMKNAYSLWIPIVLNPGGILIPPTPNTIKYDLHDVQLTTVTLRKGKMQLFIRSEIQEKTVLNYKIPSAVSPSGIPFSIQVTVPAKTSSSDGYYNETFDLSGYKINLTGLKGDKVNTMVTSFNAYIDSLAPDTVLVHAGDSVVISNKFIDISPDYAKGYFGNSTTTAGPDSADYTLFNHIIGGNLKFENINIGLNIENSIGADVRITFDTLASYNSRTKNLVPLQHAIIGSPINITRSVDKGGIVTPSTYSVSLNSFNSNIQDFIGNFPTKLISKLEFEINPLGNVSGGNDFIYYDKLLKTEMNMTIPLSIIANDLTMADTLDFVMNSGAGNINSGNLYLYAENGFPYSASVQLYAMDSNYGITDSLFASPNTILSPQLDANYISIGKRLTKLTIPVDASKISLLKNAPKLYIKVRFNTSGQPNYVKIYSFYEMKIKIVGDFNYTVAKN